MSPAKKAAAQRVPPARVRILQLTQQLDATFERAKQLQTLIENPFDQAHADYAKLLCLLLSGYLEQSFQAALNERLRAEVDLQGDIARNYFDGRFVDAQNLKVGRILSVLAECSGKWADDARAYFDDERSNAIGTLVTLRNAVAHGETPSSVTYLNMDRLRPFVKDAVRFVAELVEV